MNGFKSYHPIVNIAYFIAVIGFSCVLMHPAFLLLSFCYAFLYLIVLKGKKALKSFLYILPTFLIMSVINPLFNHEGVTVILYLPSSNPVTFESVLFGFCSSLMIVSVILFFTCFNEIVTSDKLMYLFGKVIPSFSMIISMTLRFIPTFISQFKDVINSQKCIGYDISKGSIIKRFKLIMVVVSIMITWSFENAVATADSMKARGYGLKKRSSYLNYAFEPKDKLSLFCIVVMSVYIIFVKIIGAADALYFPMLEVSGLSPLLIIAFIAYSILCLLPVIVEVWEVKKWQFLNSRI